VYERIVDSTNAAALGLAERGTPEWTIVGAGHQTAGRGRLGRTWRSEPGASLLFSLVLRPRLAPARAVVLTLGAGAAGAEASAAASRAEVMCKWPNDLVTEDGKVGGILLESKVSSGRLMHVVVGVGINLERSPNVPGAAALGPTDVYVLLSRFLVRCRDLFEPADGSVTSRVLAAYRPRCSTLGMRVRASTVTGEWVEGVAEDLDGEGTLLVRTGSELRPVAFGEVEHLSHRA